MLDRINVGIAVLLYLLIWNVGQICARNVEQLRYDTAYACEGKVLKLQCRDSEVIHLIRANYGRFSITICNDQGNTDWSVNCASPKSLRVLYARCNQQQNCSVQASTSIFSDPCLGTFKYLEAHFKCLPAALSTTTVRPSPPWLLTSQPNLWSTAKVSTVRNVLPFPTGLPPRTYHSTKIPVIKLPNTNVQTTTLVTPTQQSQSNNVEIDYTTTDVNFDFDDEIVNENIGFKNEITTQVIVVSIPNESSRNEEFNVWNEDEMCPPEIARGLRWNWTKSGEFAVQPCPGGAAGVARWRCLNDLPPKRPLSPDLSECRSLWLAGLDLRIAEGDAVTSIADDLSQVTDSKQLYGGDLKVTTDIIKKLAKKMSLNIQTYPDQRQREAIVTELLQGVVKTSSNMLDVSQLAAWHDLSHPEQMRVATYLLIGIEENSFLLADTVVREKTVIHTERNILLHVRILESENVHYEEFRFGSDRDRMDSTDISWNGNDNWIRLGKKSLLENRSEGNLLRIVYVALDRLESILVPYPRNNVTRIVNSKVISASLGKGRHIQLSEPVTICLKHLHVDNVSNPSCVFWDFTSNLWGEEGCKVQSTNRTHTICVCNHLTNFVLLADLNLSNSHLKHSPFTQIVIYIGCVISILCLFLSICTFTFLQSLKSDRTTIHQNLCICLLIAELLFVFGINQTDYSLICGLVAGFLHYFFLCGFAWTFLEGFHLYISLLEVFNVEKSRILYYYLFGYGAPLIVVTISSIVDPSSYGTNRYCWLKADNFFIFSFLAPILAVIIANLVFLSLAIYMMCKHSSPTSNGIKTKDGSRLGSSMTWLRGAIVLIFILGLTWSFGLLYLNEEVPNMTIAYIFAILNASQGLFIFIFHCVWNRNAQKEYMKILSRYFKCIEYKEEEVNNVNNENKDRRSSLYGINQSKPQSTESSSTGIVQSNSTLPNWTRAIDGEDIDEETNNQCQTAPRHSSFSGSQNLPKSSTSWSHLNKPFVWKNSNFDGANMMTEEAVKTAAVLSDTLRNKSNYGSYASQYPQQIPTTGRQRKRSRNGSLRPTSPWNHTYTEISERERERRNEMRDEDPVYEEIERERNYADRNYNNQSERIVFHNEMNTDVRNSSDISDDEFRRVSDMSRQSSRSYGDHRPLIPYSPGTDRNFHSALDAAFRQRLKEQATKAQLQSQQQQSTIAVLDGETVVCHLQPDYTPRGAPSHHQPYSEC